MKKIYFTKWHLLIFFTSLAYFAITICYGFNIYDEAITIVGAKSILNGLIPYRDFWTMYAPGQFYFLSLLFLIFGSSLLVERILTILLLSLVSLFAFIFFEKSTSQKKAFILALALTFIIGYTQLYARSIPLALTLIIIGLLFFYKFLNTYKLKYIIFTGITIAFTTLFRHDFGFYLILSYSAVIIFNYYYNSKIKQWQFKTLLSHLGLFYISIFIILIPVAIYFMIKVPFNELYSQLIYFPLNVFPEYRAIHKPIPFISIYGATIQSKIQSFWFSLVYYIPLLIYAISIFSIISNYYRKKYFIENSSLIIRILLITIGLFLYNQALIRADFEHLLPTLLISSMLIPFLDISSTRTKFKSFIIYAFITFMLIVPFAKKVYTISDSFDKSKYTTLNVKELKSILIKKELADEYRELIDFIEENSENGETIFICNNRNDIIFLNDIMLYFALNRQPAIKYFELHPGLATTKTIQEKIIDELERKSTFFIITRFVDEDEINQSARKQGATTLDEYIAKNYILAKKLQNYAILMRKNPAFIPEITILN